MRQKPLFPILAACAVLYAGSVYAQKAECRNMRAPLPCTASTTRLSRRRVRSIKLNPEWNTCVWDFGAGAMGLANRRTSGSSAK